MSAGKTFGAGMAVLGAAALTLLISSLFGLGLGNGLYGIAFGAVLGLAGPGTPLGRIVAFAIGLSVAFIAYPLRALVLNDSGLGLLLLAAFVLVIAAAIAALTKNRLPLWANLLGVAAVIGAYEINYLNAPQNLLTDLPAAVSRLILPAALAFIATIFFSTEAPPKEPAYEDDINTWSKPPAAAAPNTTEVL